MLFLCPKEFRLIVKGEFHVYHEQHREDHVQDGCTLCVQPRDSSYHAMFRKQNVVSQSTSNLT